mmetsp:Transcript_12762/g.42624  ORF Transcript_12762/g.42624 Transcript_12762/m.42624 type:complete len:376 (+) Transcript_12762:584-1711(+)
MPHHAVHQSRRALQRALHEERVELDRGRVDGGEALDVCEGAEDVDVVALGGRGFEGDREFHRVEHQRVHETSLPQRQRARRLVLSRAAWRRIGVGRGEARRPRRGRQRRLVAAAQELERQLLQSLAEAEQGLEIGADVEGQDAEREVAQARRVVGVALADAHKRYDLVGALVDLVPAAVRRRRRQKRRPQRARAVVVHLQRRDGRLELVRRVRSAQHDGHIVEPRVDDFTAQLVLARDEAGADAPQRQRRRDLRPLSRRLLRDDGVALRGELDYARAVEDVHKGVNVRPRLDVVQYSHDVGVHRRRQPKAEVDVEQLWRQSAGPPEDAARAGLDDCESGEAVRGGGGGRRFRGALVVWLGLIERDGALEAVVCDE